MIHNNNLSKMNLMTMIILISPRQPSYLVNVVCSFYITSSIDQTIYTEINSDHNQEDQKYRIKKALLYTQVKNIETESARDLYVAPPSPPVQTYI